METETEIQPETESETEQQPKEQIEYYFGTRPCPQCHKILFFNSHDLNCHLKVCEGIGAGKWRESTYSKNEQWMSISNNITLANAIKGHDGKLQIGFWSYTISQNGKYLKRRKVS